MKRTIFLKALVFGCTVGFCPAVAIWAAQPTPTPLLETQFNTAAEKYEKTKNEVQKLKDVWDKVKMEVTLYDQRAKRAYTRWAKAAKSVRKEAQTAKERAEMELKLAIEKRKLAYSNWQEAFYRMQADELKLKALDQSKDTQAIKERIAEIQNKLSPSSAPASVSR
jgi:hypothetical protein